MFTYQYGALIVPIEHAECINRIMNQVWNDSGDNFSQRLSADGQEPATHIMLSDNMNDAQKAGFPWSREAGVEVDPEGPAAEFTQQQVDDAIGAIVSHILGGASGETLGAVAERCISIILADRELQRIIPE